MGISGHSFSKADKNRILDMLFKVACLITSIVNVAMINNEVCKQRLIEIPRNLMLIWL